MEEYMKKFCKIVSAILLICFMFFVLCSCKEENSNDENNEISSLPWPEMPENNNPNFRYFSYYHFADYIDEVAGHGNVNFSKVDAECVDEIAYYYEKDIKIFIMIRDIFWDNGQLLPDYEERWEKAKTDFQPYLDKIIGFYVDEPMWTGKCQEAFHTACLTIKNDFPEKKIMAMLCYYSVCGFSDEDPAEYCKYCTDIGFDLYHTWNKDDLLNEIALLKKDVIHYGQDIWLSPKGFYVADKSKNINWALENMELEPGEDIMMWIKGAYEVAINDPSIVGFLTFSYASSKESYDYCLRDFFDENSPMYNEQLKNLYIQIGKAVIENDK